MKIIDVIGIDVSKLTLDVFIHGSKSYLKCDNTKKGFDKLCKWALSQSKVEKDNLLFVFEYTGIYSHNLAIYLEKKGFSFTIVPGLEIKRSLGISRGKDDKVDAKKIARYAYRLRDEIKPTTLPSKSILRMKKLLSLRDRMVKQRAGYKASIKEMKQIFKVKDNKQLFTTQNRMIKVLDKEIDKIEKELLEIVQLNEALKQTFNLMISIKGVGPIASYYIIVVTENFSKFKTYRKFSSYCGIAPFPYSSGTSIKGKTKVNHLANKKIKSLLDMVAKSAIQHNLEMKLYYKKKIDEGKNKMSVINAVRNKMLGRIFAVVKRQTPYVDILKYAA